MNTITIKEPVEDREYPITYTYVIGHGFSANDYKAEIIGRFGTTTEAEDHIERVNEEVKQSGGCIAFKEEFPFLILEILTIEFEKNKDSWAKQDGYHHRIVAALVAADYLSKIAKKQGNTKLGEDYNTKRKRYNKERTAVLKTKRW